VDALPRDIWLPGKANQISAPCNPAPARSFHHSGVGFVDDPTWSTIVQAWVWERGGIYFGVPLGNFLAWYLTVYLIFQLFALYLRGREANSEDLPQKYWQMTILFYTVSAIGNVLVAIPRPVTSMVTDGSGAQWQARDITGACALISIFLMGGISVLAWLRFRNRRSAAPRLRA
jgi:Carotenoid biosynthesis protein